MTDPLDRLFHDVCASAGANPDHSRTARLMESGMAKIAKKVGEEAVEVAIAALGDDPRATIAESADLIYHLCVLWAAAGITLTDVRAEIERRERALGIAEKLPKRFRENPADAAALVDAPRPAKMLVME